MLPINRVRHRNWLDRSIIRESIGTSVTATIMEADRAKVLVQASGANRR
jgi:hypothetical protein